MKQNVQLRLFTDYFNRLPYCYNNNLYSKLNIFLAKCYADLLANLAKIAAFYNDILDLVMKNYDNKQM